MIFQRYSSCITFVFIVLTCSIGSASSSSVYSGKVGLCWPDGAAANVFALAGGNFSVSWVYTWNEYSFSTCAQAGLEFVPMLWSSSRLSTWRAQVRANAFVNATHMLGFNEPDSSTQANMSPSSAATIWMSDIEPFAAKGVTLGSPSVTSTDSGKAWLTQFLSLCSGCTIDFVAIHFYGNHCQGFISYVLSMHNTFQKPIWVTEFACTTFGAPGDCDQQTAADFMVCTTSWLAAQPWVIRYSWFGAMTDLGTVSHANALLTSNGQQRTNLGDQYAAYGGIQRSTYQVSAASLTSVQSTFGVILLVAIALMRCWM